MGNECYYLTLSRDRVKEMIDQLDFEPEMHTIVVDGHINVPNGEDIYNCLSQPESKIAKRPRGAGE